MYPWNEIFVNNDVNIIGCIVGVKHFSTTMIVKETLASAWLTVWSDLDNNDLENTGLSLLHSSPSCLCSHHAWGLAHCWGYSKWCGWSYHHSEPHWLWSNSEKIHSPIAVDIKKKLLHMQQPSLYSKYITTQAFFLLSLLKKYMGDQWGRSVERQSQIILVRHLLSGLLVSEISKYPWLKPLSWLTLYSLISDSRNSFLMPLFI